MKTSRLRIDHLFAIVIVLVVVLIAVGGAVALRLSASLSDAAGVGATWVEIDERVTALPASAASTRAHVEDGVDRLTGSPVEYALRRDALIAEVEEILDLAVPLLSEEEAAILLTCAEEITTEIDAGVAAAITALASYQIGDRNAGVAAEWQVESHFAAMRNGFVALTRDLGEFESADIVEEAEQAARTRTAVIRIGGVSFLVLAAILVIGLWVRRREQALQEERARGAERVQAYADDLDAEKALLSRVIETIPLQISWKDEELRLLGCNHAYAGYLGADSDDDALFGLPVEDWSDREIVGVVGAIETEVRRSGRSALGIEVEDKSDGPAVTFMVSVVPLGTDDMGRGLLTLIQDVTERVSMQLQLQQAQKLESVGQLAAGIAHEINTPMQYIGDNAHFLKATVDRLLTVVDTAERILDDDPATVEEARGDLRTRIEKAKLPLLRQRAPKAAEDALSGVENVSRIVRAMKRFSHPGSDEMAPVDINEALDTTLTVCRNEWKYAADIETEFADDIPPVEANLGPLNQVWLNLIVNAAHAVADRFPEEKGLIRVVSRRVDDERIAVSISDNGCGIAEANLEKVFDHFFTTKEVGKGTGQGLAIAYQVVVEEHGGSIDLDSSVGVGTTFTLTLPISQSTREEGTDEAALAS